MSTPIEAKPRTVGEAFWSQLMANIGQIAGAFSQVQTGVDQGYDEKIIAEETYQIFTGKIANLREEARNLVRLSSDYFDLAREEADGQQKKGLIKPNKIKPIRPA